MLKASPFRPPMLLVLAAVMFAPAPGTLLAAPAELEAAALLPPSTVVYVELPNPDRLIGYVLDHPIYQRFQQFDKVKQAWNTPKARQLKDVVALFENRSGLKWRPTLETVTGGGVTLAIDGPTQGAVLLIKSDDQATLEKVRDTIFQFARDDAAEKGKPDPIQPGDHRGVATYPTGDGGGFAIVGPWLVVTNKPDLGKQVLDRILDAGQPQVATLAGEKQFATARGSGAALDSRAGWLYVRLDKLREAGVAPDLFVNKAKDPGAEWNFGVLQTALQHAPYATGTLLVDDQQLRLTLATPHDPANVPEARRYAFAPAGEGAAARPLRPQGTLLTVTTYRDLAAMWLAADDLFDENTAAQLAKADSDLSNFFQGKSFSGDLLTQFKPYWQFVLARQEFAGQKYEPNIKLPAGALIFQVKDPAAMFARMEVTFQTLLAFGNIGAMQQGNPMSVMRRYEKGKATILGTEYVEEQADKPAEESQTEEVKPEGNEPAPKAKDSGKLYRNFSPAMVLVGDYIMICSTRGIAEELAELAQKQGGEQRIKANTYIDVNGPIAAKLLQDNFKQLVAQNMLKEGHTLEQAENEIGLFLELVNMVDVARLDLTAGDTTMQLDLAVTLRPKSE